MSGDYRYLIPEDIQDRIEEALKSRLYSGHNVSYLSGTSGIEYQFQFDPDVENDVSFERSVTVTHEGKPIEVVMEVEQTGADEGRIKIKGRGNDIVAESSKSKYS